MQQHVKTKQHKNKRPAAGYSLPTHVLEFKCRNNSLLSTPNLTQHREALIKCLMHWTVLWYPREGSLPSWFTCSAGAVLKAIQYVSYWLTHVNHSLRKYSPSTYFVPGNQARVVNKAGKPRTCSVWRRLMQSQLLSMSASNSDGPNSHYSSCKSLFPSFLLQCLLEALCKACSTISASKLLKTVTSSSHHWLCQDPVPGLLLWQLSRGCKMGELGRLFLANGLLTLSEIIPAPTV